MGEPTSTPLAGHVAYAVKSGRLLSGTLPGSDPDGDKIRYKMLFTVGQRWMRSVGTSPDDHGAVLGPGLEVEGLREAIKTDLAPGKVDEQYIGNVLITDEHAGHFSVYSNAGAVGWASCIYNTCDGYAQSNPASAVFYFGTEELAIEPGEVALAAGQDRAVLRLTGSGSYKRYRYDVSDLPAWLNAELSGDGDVRTATLSVKADEAGKLAPGAHVATVRAHVNRGVRKAVLPLAQDAFLFPDDVLRQGAYAASDALAGESRLVLKVDLEGLRGQVHSAVLRMYGQFDVPFQLRAAAGGDWTEDTVSLENAPAAGEVVASFPVLDRGTFIQPPGPGNNGAWAEVDVTAAIEEARRGNGAAGFYVVNTTSERRWVHAREDLDFPPVLIVYL